MRTTSSAAVVLAVVGLLASLLVATPAQAGSTWVSGPDVSHWQHAAGPLSWPAVRNGGQTFAISKATEATNYVDPYFASDYAHEKASGLIRGSYHFARPALPMSTAVAQADYYAHVIGSVKEAGDLPPIMDFEVSGGLSAPDLITWGQTFLAELMARTGRVPMIYTYRYFWRTALLNSAAFTRYPLWIADYTAGAKAPTSPLVGGWSRWTMWQWTSTAAVAGLAGSVDNSHFNGTAGQLAAFADGRHPSVLAAVAPHAPVAVTAATAGNAVKVSWLPSDNGGRTLKAYRVTLSPGGATATVPGTQTSVVVPGLNSTRSYSATVKAISAAGTSPASVPSDVVKATTGLVPVAMRLATSTAVATTGRGFTLVGRLMRADGLGGVGYQPIVVFARMTGAAGYTAVTSVITAANGSFAVPLTTGLITSYSLRFGGGAGWAPKSAGIVVNVKPRVTAALDHTVARPNTRLTLRGQVSLVAVGSTVIRQLWNGRAWVNGPRTTVSASGRYSFAVAPSTKGALRFRVLVVGRSGLVSGTSATLGLLVR